MTGGNGMMHEIQLTKEEFRAVQIALQTFDLYSNPIKLNELNAIVNMLVTEGPFRDRDLDSRVRVDNKKP